MPLSDVEHARRIVRFFGEGMMQEASMALLPIGWTSLSDLPRNLDFLFHLQQAEICLGTWLSWRRKAQRREHAA